MVYRLRNERDPGRRLWVTTWAWVSVLDLAEQHGWRPYGAIQPDWLWGAGNLAYLHDGEDLLMTSYADDGQRLVLLEDALNLGEALDRAFLAYEPGRLPGYKAMALYDEYDPARLGIPGIGVILEVAGLCQSGAFWIEQV